MVQVWKLQTPLGEMAVCERENFLISLFFPEKAQKLFRYMQDFSENPDYVWQCFFNSDFRNSFHFLPYDCVMENSPLIERACRQLEEYFAGKRTIFNLPLRPAGSPFQMDVWEAVSRIPYGKTLTYGQIAKRLGMPNAARAVGLAVRSNPLPILIPCHRVMGAGGRLTGYAGGLEFKKWLLNREGIVYAAE